MKKQHGFTLVELLITLVLAAILTTVAVPSFNTTIKNNRLVTQTNLLIASFNLARSEAVKRAQAVNVCASNAAQTACSGGTDWSQGWVVWADQDASNTLNNNNEIIKVSEALPTNTTLTANNSQVQYTAQGALNVGGANPSFTVCDDRSGETGRRILVRNTGRANLSNQACS